MASHQHAFCLSMILLSFDQNPSSFCTLTVNIFAAILGIFVSLCIEMMSFTSVGSTEVRCFSLCHVYTCFWCVWISRAVYISLSLDDILSKPATCTKQMPMSTAWYQKCDASAHLRTNSASSSSSTGNQRMRNTATLTPRTFATGKLTSQISRPHFIAARYDQRQLTPRVQYLRSPSPQYVKSKFVVAVQELEANQLVLYGPHKCTRARCKRHVTLNTTTEC